MSEQAEVIEHTWVTMADGCRVSARIWLPEGSDATPVPAVLEYIPYRKSDATAVGDDQMGAFLTAHDYAYVRVDIRGTGDSDGIMEGEYFPQEQDDALEVIAWIAEQSWCSGSVGMIGISWGGFNSLQVASRRPPALKAVISLCSTDDRYADDIHYMGGCVLGVDMLSWATTMLAYNARPPRPEIVGDAWRDTWLERLDRTPPYVEDWVRHQRRDEFWKHGSINESYSDVACPVYMVGGWADAYRNAILRVLAHHEGPRKGLIGPWAHNYPHNGAPGPAIGFLHETLRWWDQWLKGEETGIMDEPMLRAWMEEPVAAGSSGEHGHWVAESTWPSPRVTDRRLLLGSTGLTDAVDSAEEELLVPDSLAHGTAAGDWLGYGRTIDTAGDQRGDDGYALTFDSAPAEAATDILGNARAVLTVVPDRPNAMLAVRLCDVSEDGASRLITRGVLNLTHHESHEEPAALVPGERYTVTVQLNAIGYRLPPGHRLRLAVASSYWPWAWPAPEAGRLRLVGGASHLELPVRPPSDSDAALPAFAEPETMPMERIAAATPADTGRTLEYDVETGRFHGVTDFSYFGAIEFTDGGSYFEQDRDEQEVTVGNTLSAAARSERTVVIERGDWKIRVEAWAEMTSTADTFELTNAIDAYEGEVRVRTRRWSTSIPRDLV